MNGAMKNRDSRGTVSKSVAGALAFALALSGTVSTQQSAAAAGPPQPSVSSSGGSGVGHINSATGKMTLGSSSVGSRSFTPHRVFANTDAASIYWAAGTSSEVADYGTLYNVGGSNIVTEYTFSYATAMTNACPVTLCNLFYEGYWGNCSALGWGLSATGGFCWSGLPGTIVPPHNTWTFTVWSTNTPLWRQNNGDFIHGMIFFDTLTGPNLCYAGSAANGAVPDGNNQDLYYDAYSPDVTTSTACQASWFGTYINNYGSWYLTIDQVDAAAGPTATSTFYCGTGINLGRYTIATPFVIGGTFQSTVVLSPPNTSAMIGAWVAPGTGTLYGYELLVDVTSLEVMGMPTASGPVARFSWTVPPYVNFAGYHLYTQAVGLGGRNTLYCAYDCVTGY